MSFSLDPDRPRLVVFSRDERIRNLYHAFLGAFGALNTHELDQDSAVFEDERDIIDRLGAARPRELWNTLCLVDLTQDDSAFDKPTANISVWAPALPLIFPEVYWIFIVTPTLLEVRLEDWSAKVWTEDRAPHPDAEAHLHFVTPEAPGALLKLIERHAGGFRTTFDPTFLRRYCRACVQDAVTDLNAGGGGDHAPLPVAGRIGRALLDRGCDLARSAQSVSENLHAALLCLDAWSILQGRPRAVSLEALQLLHQAEANAECGFLGASSTLPFKRRLHELRSVLNRLYLQAKRHRGSPARTGLCDTTAAPTRNPQEDAAQPNPSKPQVAVCLDDENDFLVLHGYALYSRGFHVYTVGTWREMQWLLLKDYDQQRLHFYRASTAVIEDLDLGFEDLPFYERNALRAPHAPNDAKDSKPATGLLIPGDESGVPSERMLQTRRACYYDGEVRIPVFSMNASTESRAQPTRTGAGSSPQDHRVLFISAVPLGEIERDAITRASGTQASNTESAQKPHGGLLDDRLSWVCGRDIPRSSALSRFGRFVRLRGFPAAPSTARQRLLLTDWTAADASPRPACMLVDAAARQELLQRYNAEVAIVDTVRDSYRRFDEFDAEEAALDRIRVARAHAGYYATRTGPDRWRWCLARMRQLISLYFASNIRSPLRLAGWCLLWILCVATLGWFLEHTCIFGNWCTVANYQKPGTPWEWVTHSALSFLMNQFYNDCQCKLRATCYVPTGMLLAAAYVQLGLLISYIYQSVSRR